MREVWPSDFAARVAGEAVDVDAELGGGEGAWTLT